MASLSVAQILMDAQRMASSVKDLDALGSALLVEAESNNRLVESLRKFQDDVDSLNRITNSKSNADMVNRIQQQNANSSEILKENRELKVCIEDYERAMELIMQKYREHASSKVLEAKASFKEIYNEKLWKVIREQREKMHEMAAVMHHAATIDDAAINRDIEIMSSLRMENKTLRELLQISRQFGSANRPIRFNELQMEEKAVQTDAAAAAADDLADDELSVSVESVEFNHTLDNTVIHLNSSNFNSYTSTAEVVTIDEETTTVCDNNNKKIIESNGNTLQTTRTEKTAANSNSKAEGIVENKAASAKPATATAAAAAAVSNEFGMQKATSPKITSLANKDEENNADNLTT